MAGTACLVLTVACAACTTTSSRAPPAARGPGRGSAEITVGSFDFPESVLLAYLYADVLAGRGYPVRVLPDLGTRELVHPALMAGLIQLVPEYTGSALEFVSLGRVPAAASVAATASALARSMTARGLVTGRPAAAQDGHSMILSAQAVPSSARLPCIAALPSGWTVNSIDVRNGQALFSLNSDRAGNRAVTVTLTARCDTSGAIRIPSDQPGARRYERPLSLQPRFTLVRMYTFAGGCVTYQFSFAAGAAPSLGIPIDTAVAFQPRSVLVKHVQRTEDLALCGRGAPCRG